MKTPFILILDGMTGSGKTTTAKLLGERIPRMAIFGIDKVKWFLSDFERGTRDNDIAKEVCVSIADTYLQLGIGVLVQHIFKSDTKEMQPYEELAEKYSVPLYKVQLFCEGKVAYERIMTRQKGKKLQLDEERIKTNISLFKNKSDQGYLAIDTTNLPPEDVVAKIRNLMQ